jgi:5-methylcytosine-specific restriction enzyme subunit McrC
VTVLPKLPSEELWYALAYGLGIDVIDRRFPVDLLLPQASFVDVLALMLLWEANGILRRGVRRGYRRRSEWVESPRGRLEAARVASALPLTCAALPCTWHELSSDTLENQVVRAGLQRAISIVDTPGLRSALRSAERAWGERCGSIHLDGSTFARLGRTRSRLTATYEPAHRVVALLVAGAGMPNEMESIQTGGDPIPGFLWNMATLFELFVARFLAENAKSVTVRTQVVLRDLFAVVRGAANTTPPRPRPDLVIEQNGRAIAVLDTKYRDLAGAGGVTRDILYQLAVYGLAYRDDAMSSAIPTVALFPCEKPGRDTVIELRPATGSPVPIVIRGIEWAAATCALRTSRAASSRIAQEWISTTTSREAVG